MNPNASLIDYLPFLLQGIPITLEVTFLSMALAVPVAVVLALGRRSQWRAMRWSAGFVIETFRGTSALIQLFWAFYVLPFFGLHLPPLAAGILVLGLNEGSYFSEVVRSGLGSVMTGQREAAITLHLPRFYRFYRIILPQALPVMIPPFGNALVGMLKFSSLVSLVTIQDLSFRAGLIRTSLGESGPIFAITLVLYFIMAIAIAAGVKVLERAVNRRAGRAARPLIAGQRGATTVPAWALGAK
jgi:polar amino acid transport system permease protein